MGTARAQLIMPPILPPIPPDKLIEVDIDLRLLDVWLTLWRVEKRDDPTFFAAVRFAYGVGYLHCLTEKVRGKFYSIQPVAAARQLSPLRSGAAAGSLPTHRVSHSPLLERALWLSATHGMTFRVLM